MIIGIKAAALETLSVFPNSISSTQRGPDALAGVFGWAGALLADFFGAGIPGIGG